MEGISNIATNNHAPVSAAVIFPVEQIMGIHEPIEPDESNPKALSTIPEKEPIKNILFIDDEEPVRQLFKDGLEKFGYTVTLASNGNEGIARFRENPADLIITDLFMPEKNGHELIHEIMQEFPGTKIFAITGKRTRMGIETELDIAQTLGAIRVYTKPIKLSELLTAIKEL